MRPRSGEDPRDLPVHPRHRRAGPVDARQQPRRRVRRERDVPVPAPQPVPARRHLLHAEPGVLGHERPQGVHLVRPRDHDPHRAGTDGRRRPGRRRGRGERGRGSRLQDRVHAVAVQRRGAHPGAARAVRPVVEPRLPLGQREQAGRLPRIHVGGPLEPGRRRQRPVVQRQGRPDERRHPPRRAGIADHPAHRRESRRRPPRAAGPTGGEREIAGRGPGDAGPPSDRAREGGELVLVGARVAARGYLDETRGRRLGPRLAPRAGDRVVPGRARAEPADHRVDPVAVPLRVGQPLEHHRRGPVAGDRTVGAVVQGARRPRTRPSPQPVRREHRADVPGEVHGARDHRVHLAPLEHARRHLEAPQARRLLAAHREARPPEAQLAGHPARRDRPQRPQRPSPVQRRARRRLQAADPGFELGFAQPQPKPRVLLARPRVEAPREVEVRRLQVQPQPDHDTRPEPVAQAGPAVLHRVRRDLHHQQLLGQRPRDLVRCDPEPADLHVDAVDVGARQLREVARHRPEPRASIDPLPPLGAARGHRDVPFQRRPPERVETVQRAEVRSDPDDRDRLDVLLRRHRRSLPAPLLHEQVRVDPAEPERRHRGTPRPPGIRPGPRLGQDLEGAVRHLGQRGRGVEVRRRRQRPVLQREQHLHEPRRRRPRQEVADVRLHRADDRGRVPEHRPQARQLRTVTGRRPRPVALHEVDLVRRPAGRRVGASHRPELPLGVGREQRSADVVGEADRRDQAGDVVPVSERVVQPLEHEDPGPLPHHEAVSAGVERRAPSRPRDRSELAEAEVRVEAVAPVHAARDHRVRPPRAEFLAGEVERVQRTRAGRVQRVRPAPEAEPVGQQRRRQPGDVAAPRVYPERLVAPRSPRLRAGRPGDALLQRAPQDLAAEARAGLGGEGDVREDDGDPRAVHRRGRGPRPGLCADPKDEPHQGVQATDPVYVEIEGRGRDGTQLEVVQEARPGRPGPPRRDRSRGEEIRRIRRPAIPRNVRDRVPALDDQPPERVQRRGPRKEARHRDDGDRRTGHGGATRWGARRRARRRSPRRCRCRRRRRATR